MNAALYARFSSDNQREESIDAQVRAITAWAASNGYEIVARYTDEARSATTDNRPGFLEMIADSSTAGWDAVIVHKLDRFARNRYDSAIYKRQLQKNGVKLISVLEKLDDSPESIILSSLLEGMNEYYSANLSREVMKGMKETAYQARHTGGVPPLGYDVGADKRYVINPKEAKIVQDIFAWYAEGLGYSEIIGRLQDEKTKTGGAFGKNSIHDLLGNEKYIGVYVFNRSQGKKNGVRNNHASKDPSEIIRIPGGIPRIIDDQTWEAVQERLRDNKRNACNKATVCYVLSGKLYCGKCGSAMVGRSPGRQRKPVYICGCRDRKKACDMTIIPADLIEQQVIAAVADLWSFDAEAAAKELLKYFDTAEEPAQVIEARRRLKEIKKQYDNMIQAVMNGMVIPGMQQKADELMEEEKHLQILASYKRDVPELQDLVAFIRKAANIDYAAPEEAKQIINRIVEKIVISPDLTSMEITFKVNKKGMAPSAGTIPMVEAEHTRRYVTFSITVSRQRRQRC